MADINVIMDFVKQSAYFTALLIAPVYSLDNLIAYALKWKKERDQIVKHKKRSNCVVSFAPTSGMRGWPDKNSFYPHAIENTSLYVEPILYFLQTANKSIDISIMSLTLTGVLDVLKERSTAGVKVRVILDFNTMKGCLDIAYDLRAIAEVRYFMHKDDIMHTKYAIKDYDDENATVILGSLNWTGGSLYTNFEDIIVIQNPSVASDYHDSFEHLWGYINHLYKTDLDTKVALKEFDALVRNFQGT